jgi:hypothetical protein
MLVNELSSAEINLWCIEKVIVGLLENKETYALPLGTVEVLDAFLRHSTRVEGDLTSSDAQDTTFLVDDDVTTSVTQLTTGGSFIYAFSSATVIRTVGFLHKGTATRNIQFEISQDNVTWTTVRSVGSASYSEGAWYWFDLDPAYPGTYFRMRDSATSTVLAAYEFFASSDGTEILAARMNRDDFVNLPNKFTQGRPLQYWFDRQTGQPVIHVWPSPDNIYDQLVIWRHRLVQDIGTDMTLTVDVPQKWLNVLVSGLAMRIGREVSEVDPQLIVPLREDFNEAMALAAKDEFDNSVMTLRPALRHYTR